MSEDIMFLPPCPLCDNGIEVYEESVIYVEDGYKALAHANCVAGIGDEDDDDFADDEDLESLSSYDPDDDDEDEFGDF